MLNLPAPAPSPPEDSPRWRAIRDVAVFHLKLFVGGVLATLILSPLSLVAGALDLLTGSRERRSLDAVLRLGKQLEQWVNLYGTLSDADPSRAVFDTHLRRIERTVRRKRVES
jgi:hypothetical protein